MLQLLETKRTDVRLLERMKIHYSQPKGFVGRNICFAVLHNDVYYGHIVAGSATRFLPGRNEFFGASDISLNTIINNLFFNVSPVEGKYPTRNFTVKVLSDFVKVASDRWVEKYGDEVLGFETLVELPRTGEVYRRAGWRCVGKTKGYSCKRTSGVGTDSWTGRRVWDTENLKPKWVFCYKP